MTPVQGIVNKASPYSVDETVARLKEVLRSKGVTLFCEVDHSGEADKAGLAMPPTKLLIFGSPKAGTPMMLAKPLMALDLPLKALVWQEPNAHVWISYNDVAYLQDRFGIDDVLVKNIAGIEGLIALALA